MTTNPTDLRIEQQARRAALVERIGTVADLACANPLPGELGALAYDLLREAAAQISSDHLHFERTLTDRGQDVREAVAKTIYEAFPIRDESGPWSWERVNDLSDGNYTRARLCWETADRLAALSTPSDGWQDISTAPKDGTLVELVVDYTNGDYALQGATLACTIGFNSFDDSGEDEWKFAGWCWSHDHFVQGKGKVVAWRPSRLNACDDGLSSLPAAPTSKGLGDGNI